MDNNIALKKIGIIVIIIVSLISFLFGISTARATTLLNTNIKNTDQLDVRFLVDSSTAMRVVDPNDSRIRVLQKLIRNLPNDSKSGVWTYGKYVNMLVPLGTVDAKWKKQAVYNLDKINSFSDYNNLSLALENSLHGWQQKSGYKKYIVILTNGGLKSQDSVALNSRERYSLLTKTLPKLKNAGIKIHAISFGQQADNKLLKTLAAQTNGKWYAVNDAKLLSSVMNHSYKQIDKDFRFS
jgi:hypothetical protein